MYMEKITLLLLFVVTSVYGYATWQHVYAINPLMDSGAYVMRVRCIRVAADPVQSAIESDIRHQDKDIHFDAQDTALILIDVWDQYFIDGYGERVNKNVKEKLLPALNHARDLGLTIIHCHHMSDGGDYRINPNISILPGEYVVDGSNELNELDALLKSKGIKLLIYAGYATNMCIQYRPVGIQHMSSRGYQIVLLRDATEAIELPELLPMGTMREAAVSKVEMFWGYTTTTDIFCRI
jgi:nicotinamidase-related amidase